MQRSIKSNKSRKSKSAVNWVRAADIQKRTINLISSVDLDWIEKTRIYCFRSENTSTRAYARIWGLPRIWQLAMDIQPAYVIEVISEKFDRLTDSEKDEVLLHELTHIPRNFSGSLVPHIRRGKRNFYHKVKQLVDIYNRGLNRNK